MDYQKLIIDLLEDATDSQLRTIYLFIFNYLF